LFPPPINILVLASGNGTNLQALIDAQAAGALNGGRITQVISDRRGVYALERAKAAGIPTLVIEMDKNASREMRRNSLSELILRLCREKEIGLIVQAGFLSILTGDILETYSGRIINLHPALLPKFGGEGMYGEKVHRAVIAAGETESGCTVHLVDSGIDTGPILLQRKVPVLPGDTPGSLAERIHGEEHIIIVEAVIMMLKKISPKE